MYRSRVWLDRPHSHPVCYLRSVFTLCLWQSQTMGIRCHEHAIWHLVHDGRCLCAGNGCARSGDVLYGFFPIRLQASLDLLLYFVFYFPGVIAFVWAGYIFAGESFVIREHSNITADGPPIYPFKMIIPFAGVCLIFQGIAEVYRCVQALKHGIWPDRIADIEEVDVDNLKTMVSTTAIDEETLKEIETEQSGEQQ